MDRRSWLWRRKSSDKRPAETDNSGSFSSHSERFSDDQVYPIHNSQSPEVTSKALPAHENINDDVKTLREKLCAALLDISVKEDLLKQHAKVAEEAVSGWEKAEEKLLSLKQQLEAAIMKNSELENRVGHLDAALKECVRQLRQDREEQEQRVNEALAKKTCELESMKSDLERKLDEVHTQLQTAKSEAAEFFDSDLQKKLEATEKELEIRIMEQDLTTQAAETASKQHLESIKKVAKLEAECRRLKNIARKYYPASDLKSLTSSSIYVEFLTDSQSDSGERHLVAKSDAREISVLEINECRPSCSGSLASALISELGQSKSPKTTGRNLMVPSVEIDLMDDFLEMERLAAFPDTESGYSYLKEGDISDQAMVHSTAQLEEKLEKLEEEKVEIQKSLTECQMQLEMSQSQLKEADTKLLELQSQLALASKVNAVIEEDMESIKSKRELVESRLLISKTESKSLLSEVGLLGSEVEKECALSAETLAKSGNVEDELSKRKREAELQNEAQVKHIASADEGFMIKQEKELAVAASKFAECQKTISSLGRQLKFLATMDEFLVDAENSLDISGEGLKCLPNGGEQWRLHCGDKYIHHDVLK